MQMTKYIDILQQFCLDLLNVEIKTKTKCGDYYYSTLLLIIIHIVNLSNQSEIFIEILKKKACTAVP